MEKVCRRPGEAGLSLVEVMVAMSVLVVGTLTAFNLVATSGLAEEKSSQRMIAYKACQEAMEVLMTMDKQTLLLQRDPGQDLGFDVPALDSVNPPRGTYEIVDVTAQLVDESDTDASPDLIQEVRVMFDWKGIKVSLTARRTF